MAWKMINMTANCCNRKYYKYRIANKSTQACHPIFKFKESSGFLNLEEGIDWLFQNVGKELPLLVA
jgi:hypothetical protein